AVALAAIDAQDWARSREAMQPVLTNSLSERACLIMADIEEGEHGDRGRMRDWLARAVRAPRDPAWTADGYVSEKWLPISPVSGEIGAFQWKLPVEQLGAPAEAIDIDELTKPLVVEPKKTATPDDVSDKVKAVEKPDVEKAELVEPINGADQEKEAKALSDNDNVEGVEPLETQTAFPLKRRPDDPGVRKEGDEEKAFKFF
ncbi:MAG: heme biosynthesis protein HemY, partial [Rhizobiaceae bacterium]|nr:heme biosynthesis protein HemY [Rhizobiaceae bacterium]